MNNKVNNIYFSSKRGSRRQITRTQWEREWLIWWNKINKEEVETDTA